MKAILFFFIVIGSVSLDRKKNNSLKITIIECSDTGNHWFFPALRIYKLPEDTLYLDGARTFAKNGIFEIAQFIPGTYRFEYTNIFGERVKRLHKFEDCQKNEIRICLDEPEVHPDYFQTLSENDSTVIDFSSSGCFHNSSEKMTITMRSGTYEAKVYPTVTRLSLFKDEPIRKGPEKIILTEKNILDLKEFLNELNLRRKGDGCTTVDHYTITGKWGVKEVIDAGCEWRGFWKLRRSFVVKE